MRRLWRIASGESWKSTAISAGDFRWRSAFWRSRRPASSSVVPSRMQVRTSSSARPAGRAWRTSLVATTGTPCAAARSARRHEALAGALAVAVDVDGEALAEDGAQPPEVGGGVRPRERPLAPAGEAVEAARVRFHLLPAGARFALRPPEGARREEPAEVPVAVAVLDEQPEETSAVDCHLGPDQRPDAGAARGREEARRAVDAAAVRERERVVAECRRPIDQVLGQRGAGEEAEGAPAAQLDVVSRRRHRDTSGPMTRSALRAPRVTRSALRAPRVIRGAPRAAAGRRARGSSGRRRRR